jgi:hypothetical protein
MSIQKLVKELYKCCPIPDKAGMALVLYDTRGMLVAIGKDADKLYLTLGWELSDFADEGLIYSYMIVSTIGIKVLQQLGIEYQTIKVPVSQDIDGESLATTQQALDYLRLQAGSHSFTYPFVCQSTIIESIGYIREVRITSLTISRETVVLCIDNSEQIELISGHEWNFSHTEVTLLSYISAMIKEQFAYLLSFIQDPKQVIKDQKLQNTELYKRYINEKAQTQADTLVLVKVQNVFLTFDDDAITAASLHRNILLYECNVIGYRGRTVALIEISQYQALQQITSISVIDSHYTHPLYQLGLKESFMNHQYNQQIIYTGVAIRKCKTGDYVIIASYNGTALPETFISNTLGAYIINLPDSKERNALLVSLAHQTYDKSIMP